GVHIWAGLRRSTACRCPTKHGSGSELKMELSKRRKQGNQAAFFTDNFWEKWLSSLPSSRGSAARRKYEPSVSFCQLRSIAAAWPNLSASHTMRTTRTWGSKLVGVAAR